MVPLVELVQPQGQRLKKLIKLVYFFYFYLVVKLTSSWLPMFLMDAFKYPLSGWGL